MNLDDESQLSAYLDDELDPANRRSVEWSVESSPPLADQLRSIAQARDLVAALDRPGLPRDLAPAVGARIASNRRRARLRSIARPAQIVFALSGFSTIAASLIFAVIRLNQSLHDAPARPAFAAQDQPASSPRTHTIASNDPRPIPNTNPISIPAPASLPRSTDAIPPETKPFLVASVPTDLPGRPSGAAGRSDRRVIDGILGRSHVRRIVIVTDVIDAPERIRRLIQDDPRETPEFGRISIQQEIVIDPEHADAAEVFAVPINERGRRSFVERLQKIFPELIEEGRSKSELVAQLTQVGQVAVFRGVEAAPLGDPPGDLTSLIANREADVPALLLEPDRSPVGPARPKPSTSADRPRVSSAVGESAPKIVGRGPDFVGPPDAEGKAPPKPGEKVTLLVWVTRPSRH